jgi:hypothetical protein
MATTKVVDVLDRAGIILQDNTNVRFPKEELLKFFNDAQKEVVLHRPDAKMVNTNYDCIDGSKQTLPSEALRLIEVVRNVGGRAITQVQKRILDETVASTNKIEHFIYDPADPKNFYVYPKGVSGTHSLEIVYSSSPPEISISNFATDDQYISLDDVYANCILDYVLYRSYQKDSEFAGNAQRAMMHYQSFANALGVKTQADGATTPVPASAGAGGVA